MHASISAIAAGSPPEARNPRAQFPDRARLNTRSSTPSKRPQINVTPAPAAEQLHPLLIEPLSPRRQQYHRPTPRDPATAASSTSGASPCPAPRRTVHRRPSRCLSRAKIRMSTVSSRHNPARNALPASERRAGPQHLGKDRHTVARQVMACSRRTIPAAGRAPAVRRQVRCSRRPPGVNGPYG